MTASRGQAMNKTKGGFSLVELLVVLGIIGLLASIAVPTVRMYMNSDPTSYGARILFQAFKAAKVYAGANNTRCAVVFNIREVEDSLTGETVHVFDAVMMARELKRAELIEAGIPLPGKGRSPVFVPIVNDTGTFTFLPKGTCILGEGFGLGRKFVQAVDPDTGEGLVVQVTVDGELVTVPDMIEVDDLVSDTGLFAIRVIENRWPNLMGPIGIADELDTIFTDHLPAYVFGAEGTLDVSDSFTKQRVVLTIGVLPDNEIEERFQIDPDTGDPELDGNDEPIQLVTTLTLYHSTGRIKIGQ